MQTLKSIYDSSVNFVIPYKSSVIECRYVRRADHYISTYLSSHNGCNMGCKFCWLTASGQNSFNHVTTELYVLQLDKVLNHAKEIDQDSSKNVRININMMARGESLANKYLVNSYDTFYDELQKVVDKYDYKEQKINVSTIMPYTIKDKELKDIFNNKPAYLYYSLYSINQSFRDKWLPNALPHKLALNKLKNYQDSTDLPLTIHFCLIEGENDNLDDIRAMATQLEEYNFNKLKFNIIAFNPDPNSEYKESSPNTQKNVFDILKSVAKDTDIKTNKTRQVARVGYDVKVSCGMFV